MNDAIKDEAIVRGETLAQVADDLSGHVKTGSGPVPVERNTGQEICECGHLQSEHIVGIYGDFKGKEYCKNLSCTCQQFKPKEGCPETLLPELQAEMLRHQDEVSKILARHR